MLQAGFEMFHVCCAELRLPLKPIKLRAQNGRLKFTHAVVESADAVMILVSHAGASGIDVALLFLHVLAIVGGARSASPRRNQLARLETEGAQVPHRTCTLALPHSAMRVGAILNHLQV